MRTLVYKRTTVPKPPTGAALDIALEIIVPESTTNLFLNPSWETNTSNWTASSDGSTGTPYDRGTTYQFRGAYSAILTIRPSGGSYVQIVNASISNTTQYTMSFHVRKANKGVINKTNARAYVNGALVDFNRYEYVGDGWHRCVITWTSTSTSGVGIRVLGSPSQAFYIDAAQLEQKGYPTTYCDGDQLGLLSVERVPAFYWTGTAHGSTSVRSATTRAGGKPVNVKTYGLLILALIGLGLSPRSVIATPLGLADGSQYQRTIREARTFTLAGVFQGNNGVRDTSARRGALRALLNDDLTGDDQPTLLRLQRFDGSDPIGDQILMPASYISGLEETFDQPFAEEVSAQFQAFLPMLRGSADRGASLGVQSSVANANYIVQRSASGTWAATGTGMNAYVRSLAIAPDGSIYAGGIFTTSGGTTTNGVAKWDGSSWSALGGTPGVTAGNIVYALAVGPDGSLYAGGTFSTAGGGAVNKIAKWNGSAWSALGSGLNGDVFGMGVGPDGSLYVGGAFTTAGGGAANYIAKWDGSAWSALGSGMNSAVVAFAFGIDGSLYAGGSFTTAGGGPANRIAKWNGSTWSALGSGLDSAVNDIAVAPDGSLYAIGSFTTAGGSSANRIARWNGSSWSALGSGLDNTGLWIGLDYNNQIIVTGVFTTAGGVVMPDGMAIWNGSQWIQSTIDLPGATTVYALLTTPDGRVFVGFTTSGTAYAATMTTVTNPGTMPSGIKIVITGPTSGSGYIYNLTNTTTGKIISFNNLVLTAGETATLTVDNGVMSLMSSFRGPINSAILPSSDDDFSLIKGSNNLSFFASDSTMTATLTFTPAYESFDDVTMAIAL